MRFDAALARDPSNAWVAALLRQLRAYESALPPPLDPFSQVVRSVLARAAEAPATKPVRVVVRSPRPGPPSAHVALALGLARLGLTGELVVEWEGGSSAATPTGPLWRLEGGRLVPALRRPSPAVIYAVTTLAREPFDRAAEWSASWLPSLRRCMATVLVLTTIVFYFGRAAQGTSQARRGPSTA